MALLLCSGNGFRRGCKIILVRFFESQNCIYWRKYYFGLHRLQFFVPILSKRYDEYCRMLLYNRSPIVYIDIVDKSEDEAKQEILNGIENRNMRKSKGFPAYYSMEHLEIDLDYYVEDTRIVYIKTCKSKVLAGGKNKIHNRITWFADEEVDLVSLTEGVNIEYLDLRDTNLNYNVVFDHILEKGEEIEFRVKAILTNHKKHFANFFSTEVITPIKHLNMHLNLADVSIKKIYTQKLSSSPMNIRTESPKEHMFYSPYHWRISNPELNFEYKSFGKILFQFRQ